MNDKTDGRIVRQLVLAAAVFLLLFGNGDLLAQNTQEPAPPAEEATPFPAPTPETLPAPHGLRLIDQGESAFVYWNGAAHVQLDRYRVEFVVDNVRGTMLVEPGHALSIQDFSGVGHVVARVQSISLDPSRALDSEWSASIEWIRAGVTLTATPALTPTPTPTPTATATFPSAMLPALTVEAVTPEVAAAAAEAAPERSTGRQEERSSASVRAPRAAPINQHDGAPVALYGVVDGLLLYAITEEDGGQYVMKVSAIAWLEENHEGGELTRAEHPASEKPIVVSWLPVSGQIEINTFYDDVPPHQMDKPYIIRIDAANEVEIVAW